MKIDLASVVSALGPFIIQLLAGLIMAALGWLVNQLSLWLKFQMTEAQWRVIHSTAEAAAGQIWADASPEIATLSITPTNPLVAAAANSAIKTIPDVLKQLGITPQTEEEFIEKQLAPLIAAKLGAMQSHVAIPSKT
jgi:hypothetical protein